MFLWYSPTGVRYAGWRGHGKGAVDFWVEGTEDTETEVLTTSDSSPAVDGWTHVVGGKRGSETVLYMDGKRTGSSSLSFEGIDYAVGDGIDLVLGRHAGGRVDERHFQDDLDSVALWTEALSESRFDDLFEASSSCR